MYNLNNIRLKNIDQIFAKTGIFLILLVYAILIYFRVFNPLILYTLLYILFGLILYSIYSFENNCRMEIKYRNGKLWLTLLNIIFLAIFSYSLYILSDNLYYRPVSYFILISVLYSLLILEIILSNESKSLVYSVLFKLILISFNIRWGILYEFPSLIEVDTYFHINFVKSIIKSGFIDPLIGRDYVNFPLMHILVSITNILTNLNYKDSLSFSIGFPSAVIITIFIFLLGKKLFSVKIGLLAAIIFSTSNYGIRFGFVLIAMSYGIILFSMLYYLIFCRTDKKAKEYKILFLIISITIILTHTISAFIFFLLILFSAFINHFKSRKDSSDLNNIKSNTVILFFVIMIGYWSNSFYVHNTSFFNQFIMIFRNALMIEGSSMGSMSASSPPIEKVVSQFDVFLNSSGFLLYIMFSIVGSLFVLKHNFRTKDRVIIVFLWSAVFFLALFSSGLASIGYSKNSNMILPERWFVFQSILMSIPWAYGINSCYNLSKKRNVKIVIILIITVTSFLMITSTNANMDSPIYAKSNAVLVASTDSELNIKILNYASDRVIASDTWTILTLSNKYINKFSVISKNDLLIGTRFEFVLLSKRHTVSEFEIRYNIDRDFISKYLGIFDSQKYNKIYDNGNIIGNIVT